MDGFTPFWALGLAVLSMALLFLIPLFTGNSSASSSSDASTDDSGACQQYQGEARILSITPAPGTTGTYEIKFSFHPEETVREAFADPEDREWSLFQKDWSIPRKDFIQKYGLAAGKRLPCTMHVITRGACTPVQFDFPTIDEGRGR